MSLSVRHPRRHAIGSTAARALVALAVLISSFVGLAVLSVTPVAAQGAAPQIGQAALQLWPEFDDPGILVIYSGALTGTTFPQTVAFPVPAGARNIQATYRDASGSLISRNFELKDGKVSYDVLTADFHLEYYVDRQPAGNQRDITYTFETPYPIAQLQVAVQQPARATDFALQPAAQTTEPRSDGMTYGVFTQTNLAADAKLPINIRYVKTDTGLSQPQLAVTQPTASGAPASGASAANTSWLPWVLIGIGAVALVAAAVYWFLTQRRPAASRAGAGRAGQTGRVQPRPGAMQAPRGPVQAGGKAINAAPPSAVTPPAVRPPTSGDTVFCTQCGKPLRPDDRFCSQCGAPRRG